MNGSVWKVERFVVVAYFTVGTLYEARARILQASLDRHRVPYYIEGVPNLGSWDLNTSYKPTFIKQMLAKWPDQDIVYVDVDAEFQQYPDLFETLGSTMKNLIAAYVFDRSCYRRSAHGFELLSGTLYFRNVDETVELVDAWEKRTQMDIKEWDQKSLEHVLKGKFDVLPGEYCKIFDRMPEVTRPVIVHFQASRGVRKSHGCLL